MALTKRSRKIDSSIDLTPLIDVVFQLLIFLMVSSQFTKPEAVVELPQAPGKAAIVDPARDKISLAIQADGKILLDNKPIPLEALGLAIGKMVETGVTRVEVRGDQVSEYGIFVEVMEIARAQGVESLGVVKKREGGDAR
jgi:biopolymer transport protein ExbD